MIKHFNNVAPRGRHALHLDERRKKMKKKKKGWGSNCATANHTTCLGEVMETDACAFGSFFSR